MENNEQELYKDKFSSSDLEEHTLFGEVIEDEEVKSVSVLNENNSVMPVNPENLISIAIEKGTSVDVMERLLAMRKELKAEAAREAYFKALADFQSDCPVIEKRKIVKNKNGTIRYKYAPLEDILSQVKHLLKRHGFSYVIKTGTSKDEKGEEKIIAICVLHHSSGHAEETEFPAPIYQSDYMNNIQKVASALTYAKRYAFCNATGILTGDEDDDSNVTDDQDHRASNQKTENKNGIIDFNDAPEENRALYSSVMALFREKINGKPILTQEEMANYKKNADALLGNYDGLVDFYQSINKIIQLRRRNTEEVF